jgi:alanyl-tRNA synthetase
MELPARIGQIQEQARALEKELERLRSKVASNRGGELAEQAAEVKGVKVLAARMDGADARALREALDQLKARLGSAVVVLGSAVDGKVQLAAGVTADLTARVKAGELVAAVAAQVGGKGGGKADMAMAGGNDPAGLDKALASVRDWTGSRL